MKRVLAFVLATIMCLSLVGCLKSGIDSKLSRMSVEKRAEYLKENCNSYDYEYLIRYPNTFKNRLIVITGEVTDGSLWTTEDNYDIELEIGPSQRVVLKYRKFYDDLRLFKGDKVTVYGVYSDCGVYPEIIVYYAELNSK